MKMFSQYIQGIAILFMVMAAFLTLVTLFRYKIILIKLVCLEVLVNLFICFIGIWVLKIHFSFLLDVCIALSLIMFLSTTAYCQFLMKEDR